MIEKLRYNRFWTRQQLRAWQAFRRIQRVQEGHNLLVLLEAAGWKETWPWVFCHLDFPAVRLVNETVEANDYRPWEVVTPAKRIYVQESWTEYELMEMAQRAEGEYHAMQEIPRYEREMNRAIEVYGWLGLALPAKVQAYRDAAEAALAELAESFEEKGE